MPISALSAYPLIPNFLLPPESSSLYNHDLSHVPRVEPADLEVMPIHVPVGEGSSRGNVTPHLS